MLWDNWDTSDTITVRRLSAKEGRCVWRYVDQGAVSDVSKKYELVFLFIFVLSIV